MDSKEGTTAWIEKFYHASLVLLVASIPLSKYTTSLSQFMVLGFWLLYGMDLGFLDTRIQAPKTLLQRSAEFTAGLLSSLFYSLINHFKAFFRNRIAMILTSLILLHVLGLIHTSDYGYAFKDLRTKLPLLLLPLFFSTGPSLSNRTLKILLISYAMAIFGGTIYRLYLFLNLPISDPRGFNPHISHIRFSLNAVYAAFILIYYTWQKHNFPVWSKWLFVAMTIWFLFFMAYMRYLTGISLTIILLILILTYMGFRNGSPWIRIGMISGGLILIILPLVYFRSVAKEFRSPAPVSFHDLDRYTLNGNSYYHDTVNFKVENGKYSGLYICDKELRKSWKERSDLPIDGEDRKNQPLRFTLIRYLAAKDLRKDSVGISQLSSQDIRNIESGLIHPSRAPGFQLKTQVNNFLIGWDNYRFHGNPNSSSLIQRLEYWRTSLIIIKENPIAGVGTGDVPEAFNRQYQKMNSSLDPKFRLRSHNQYLSITIALGLVGLVWFLFVLTYPMIRTRSYKQPLYLIFWIILIISMFTEDTIETQEGVTFFAFFTSLYLLGWRDEG